MPCTTEDNLLMSGIKDVRTDIDHARSHLTELMKTHSGCYDIPLAAEEVEKLLIEAVNRLIANRVSYSKENKRTAARYGF